MEMEKKTFALFIGKLFLDIYMIILVKGFKKKSSNACVEKHIFLKWK